MIETIVQILHNATSLPVKSLYTDEIENCIVYNYYSLSDDGAVSRDKLEIRLITDTFANADIYRKQIINALVNTGDNIKINGIYNCNLNGGSVLKEYATNTIHTMMYFDLIVRSNNVR